jgi:hydrogenase small subunit
VASKVVEYPALWVAGAACSGCSVSLLNTINPGFQNVIVDPVVPGKHVSLKFHATIMAGSGEPVVKILREIAAKKPNKYILIVDGSIPTADGGAYCTLGASKGREITMKEATADLARGALAVIAVGTCASFGGIPAGSPNPTGAKSVQDFLKEEGIDKPIVNVPGCPPHPDWMVGTVAHVLLKGLPTAQDLDDNKRPKAFYGRLIHDNCPRRGLFDAGRFARHTGDEGCLFEIGCKGPYSYADCPTRQWNNGVNWCVGAGAQCIGCVEPDFHDRFAPLFQKIDENGIERLKIKTR